MNNEKRKYVDLLIEQFWKKGYLTISRKFGTYLPEPSKVGKYEVDIVARQKNNYAIGITLSPEDLNDPQLRDKLIFLATRQTKYSSKKVLLFIGVEEENLKSARALLNMIEAEIRKNIKLFPIIERSFPVKRKRIEKVLFS